MVSWIAATGRRAYGLGSIGKIFGKVAKAAKKVLKSDVGRSWQYLGAAMYGLSFRWGIPGTGTTGTDRLWTRIFFKQGAMGQRHSWSIRMLPFFMGQPEDKEEDKGANYDLLRDKYAQELMNIKAGVSAGSLNPNQWSYLPSDYTYTGAEGGRAGYYAGGQSIPSEYTAEDAMMATTQDKLGGITEAMKRADLFRKGSVGQMYAAEGGLMDMGGMEKDYRNDGGFVPIGGKEKADDVPARLSRNEFVFTADAVRGAGGGDIDKGAEIMENVMKNLEQGGQVSEETQGLAGAQEMFGVSERLSEVV